MLQLAVAQRNIVLVLQSVLRSIQNLALIVIIVVSNTVVRCCGLALAELVLKSLRWRSAAASCTMQVG